jgi:uncharacterized protein (DUF1684 family)
MVPKFLYWCFFVLVVNVLFPSCQTGHEERKWSSDDSLRIVQEILAYRAEADSFFRYDPDSPFRRDTSIEYEGVRWYPPNVNYYLQSQLHRYANPETVIVMGTHGEERRHLKYGYFRLKVDGKDIRLNAYKFLPSDSKRYALYKDHLSVWFTDHTTGKETYKVGRYLDVGTESPDTNFLYTINFNNAYNPYCAYSDMYSCVIPRREDHLGVAIHAGELKYADHD